MQDHACTAIGMVPGVKVAVAGKTPSPVPTTQWTVTACTKTGGCETATGTPTSPFFIGHPDVDSTAIGVTAYAADQSGAVAPGVTTTVTPGWRIDNPTCGPSAYYATVTVTPTR